MSECNKWKVWSLQKESKVVKLSGLACEAELVNGKHTLKIPNSRQLQLGILLGKEVKLAPDSCEWACILFHHIMSHYLVTGMWINYKSSVNTESSLYFEANSFNYVQGLKTWQMKPCLWPNHVTFSDVFSLHLVKVDFITGGVSQNVAWVSPECQTTVHVTCG